eukprot:TRINITY_DN835_c0_g1_i1.p1 TRINITY_DN835_c0_g1~~TRINITY_DN835_c0_g1_i1.p1  ORF type:complete len:230 (-),score=55.71 TRINITY_DN835_c0_g1_i1:58-720(-)
MSGLSLPCKPVLHYFPIRGKAEPIRLMLEDLGAPYEDVRLQDWLQGRKKEYIEKGWSPFGQLPVLDVNGQFIGQSVAIMRLIANWVGLRVSDPMVQCRDDALVESTEDWRRCYVKPIYGDWENMKDEYINKTMVNQLDLHEKFLSQGPDGGAHFTTGPRPAVGDYLLWEMLDLSLRLDAKCLDSRPVLQSLYKRFLERPNVRAYIDSGRRPERPNNSKNG